MHYRRPQRRLALAFVTIILITSCVATAQQSWTGPVVMPKRVKLPPGADPNVSAEMGGAGFEAIARSQGWSDGGALTPEMIALLADTTAKKGGAIRTPIGDFPATFRMFGKDASTATNQRIYSLVYESLIGVNPLTLEFMPSLASHWRIDPADGNTYWFRIDPNARWHDGNRVTTADVMATWKLGLDEGILDPFQNAFEREFEMPVAVSPYLLKVRSRIPNWKNMLYFGGQPMMPAHEIGGMTGKQYLVKYQYQMPVGSGPYVMLKEGFQRNRSITLTRVADWWARDNAHYRGQFNFDQINWPFIEDENVQYLRLREGKIDVYHVGRSQWWVEKFAFDEVKRGLIEKRKVWNDKPNSISGLAFNMRKPPFDDPRVRQAVVLLIDRPEIIRRVIFNERIVQDSYFPNSPYENPRNPKYRPDPARARQLLSEAGYTSRNAEGILVRNGQPFEIEMPIDESSEIILTPIQQDLREAGIKVNFHVVDFAQKIMIQDARDFDIVQVSYTGIIFPNPEGQFSSALADLENNNNITGFKNARADEIIALEKVTADPNKRVELLQELDSILMATNAYALFWYSPFERFAVWKHIRMPEFGYSRISDYRDIYQYWWFDPEVKREVEKAWRNRNITLVVPPVDITFWRDWRPSSE